MILRLSKISEYGPVWPAAFACREDNPNAPICWHGLAAAWTSVCAERNSKRAASRSPRWTCWADLEARAAPDQLEFYKILLIHLGSHGSTLVQESFTNASSFIKKPATLSTLVAEIDKIDW